MFEKFLKWLEEFQKGLYQASGNTGGGFLDPEKQKPGCTLLEICDCGRRCFEDAIVSLLIEHNGRKIKIFACEKHNMDHRVKGTHWAKSCLENKYPGAKTLRLKYLNSEFAPKTARI